MDSRSSKVALKHSPLVMKVFFSQADFIQHINASKVINLDSIRRYFFTVTHFCSFHIGSLLGHYKHHLAQFYGGAIYIDIHYFTSKMPFGR